MALNAGDSGCTTGLSARIYSQWTGDFPNNGFAAAIGSMSASVQNSLKSLCYAVALGVVAEIQANATVTIKTTDGGLQTSATAGSATTAPASNKTLPGGCIG